MQGWRISMEDAHAAVLDLKSEESEKPTVPDQRLSFFGVYDGHGGDKVAYFAGENVHKVIAKQDAFKMGEYDRALKDGFLAVDRAILNGGPILMFLAYTSFNAQFRRTGALLTIGIGEKARIVAAGGFVDFGRVNGNLALSRAIGDFEFKKSADLTPEHQIVTAYPDVIIHDISEDDEFLVIACDGIWDCQSSQAVIEFVRRGITAKQELHKICENMMDNCCASSSETGGVGCDNMTMIVVGILNGRTKEEWYDAIAKRVANGDGPSEFRGPGIHTQFRDESPDDLDHRMRDLGRPQGRIILLGDGNELPPDADTEMSDHDEEDKDLESQVIKGPTNPEQSRSEREGTPGPNTTHLETLKEKASDDSTSQTVGVNHYPINPKDGKMETTAH
ncbi:hypothetical protein GP486_006830 [Trichoglossum hirsutum]|uniref:protein-serine/threonine phosphatase n=1 Tax=Trichoglossum hirsutum TaxID=265104 RepID=A0A9P8L5A6_9PEZI|nr:hypothetical protein GP486_006830 [Trichoglossum hirsutum]